MDRYESSKPVSGYCFIKKYKMQNIHVLLHKTNHAFLSNLIMSSSYACMCDRFAYVSPSVCPTCVTMLRCVNVECSANCKVCFDYLVRIKQSQ